MNRILEKIYAGFLGMNAGIRLGAPVEPAFWSSERIQEYYGDIRGYVKSYKHFAADDDANGPVFFLRALDDREGEGLPAAGDVAEAWLNYAREGVGLYWWGGYGISTEHTAYLNLKRGVPAPESGSIRVNGKTLAEQIGGQIFIDTWGLIAPGDPDLAARMATAAASVSHDGEGLCGAAFMAAAIAAAFEAPDIGTAVAAGLARIPARSKYRKVFAAVESFHRDHPEDWRGCLAMLQEKWGYDRYPGVCHIIPNAGVCALSLYYGAGDFARTIEIAAMCGWDTDCNAGNVGTILGVLCGLEGIPERYREPIGDGIVLSGISGYLNILDLPTYARKLYGFSRELKGLENDEPAPKEGTLDFDFSLPGSTHGFTAVSPMVCVAGPSEKYGGSFRCFFEKLIRGQNVDLGRRTFWRRRDFDDERYMPVFSPLACPGQTARFRVVYEKLHGDAMSLTPYVRETYSGKMYTGSPVILREGPSTLEFTLPEVDGGVIEEVGLRLTSLSQAKLFDRGSLYLTGFTLTGPAAYSLDLGKAVKEFGSVLPFSHNHGAWELEDGRMTVLCESHAEAMTGNYFARDVVFSGHITPENGDCHLLGLRVQGARRGLYAGLIRRDGEALAALCRNSRGKLEILKTVPFPWEWGREYALTAAVRGETLSLSVDGKKLLRARVKGAFPYGMVSFALYAPGRAEIGDITIRETEEGE